LKLKIGDIVKVNDKFTWRLYKIIYIEKDTLFPYIVIPIGIPYIGGKPPYTVLINGKIVRSFLSLDDIDKVLTKKEAFLELL